MKIYLLLIILAYSALGDPLPGRSSGGGSRSSGGSRSGGYSHTSYSRPSTSHTSYSSHSYPSSGGLSGHSVSAPKVHVTNTHSYPSTNTHSYPSSNTHSYPSSNTHSYPSSGGLSGNTGTIPKVSVPNTHSYPSYPSSGGLSGNAATIPKAQVTNTHTYPSSNTHSYPPSGHSNPVHTTFTASYSRPSYTSQGQGHSYPSSNGMSGTGTGYRPYTPNTNNYNTHTSHPTYNNPSHISNSYHQPTYHQPSYNQPIPHYTPYSPQYGGGMPAYGHSYTPLYSSGVPHYGAGMSGPTYVSYTSSSGSSLNNVVAGLALYNLMRSNSQSHHYYHHYDNNNNYNNNHYNQDYNNNNYNQDYNRYHQFNKNTYHPPTVEASRGLANCTLYVKSGEESSKIDVPCEFVSSFTDDTKKNIDQNLPKVNSTDECVITSTKNGILHKTNISCAALEKLAMLQNAPLAGTLNCTEALGANMYTMTGAPPCKMLETTQPPDVPFEVLPLGYTTTGVPLAPYSSTTAGTPLASYPSGISSTTLSPESTTNKSPPSPDVTTKDGLLDVSVLPLNSTV